MIGLLVYLIILCVVFGILYAIVLRLPLPDPFGWIAQLLLLLVFVLVLVSWLLPLAGIHPFYSGSVR
jgi:hypothetical protein